MGSQLRFDPSFFGLALRAAAEADVLFFSAHKDLPITRCPTRAGLRLTSPAKASGEWEDLGHQRGWFVMHKEKIPLHKESGFLCRKERVAEAGIRQKYVRIRTRQEGDERGTREQAKQRGTRRARGKHSPAYHSMSRGGCQGEYTPGGVWGWKRIGWGNERK